MEIKLEVEALQQEITKINLGMKSLIQEINECTGPMENLTALNTEGRSKLSALRGLIDKLETFGNENKSQEVLIYATNQREQYYSTFNKFRKANVTAMLAIEKSEKDELLGGIDGQSTVRLRQKKDKENLVKMSSGITDQLLSISRHLSETTQLSADTLSSLANSSTTVSGTSNELVETRNTLSQSGKLLAKYSRRQFTDKLILFLGFAFFFLCVVYIIKKRVF